MRDEFLDLTRAVELCKDSCACMTRSSTWASQTSYEESPFNSEFVRNSVQLIREVTFRNWFYDLRALMATQLAAHVPSTDLTRGGSGVPKAAESRRLGAWAVFSATSAVFKAAHRRK